MLFDQWPLLLYVHIFFTVVLVFITICTATGAWSWLWDPDTSQVCFRTLVSFSNQFYIKAESQNLVTISLHAMYQEIYALCSYLRFASIQVSFTQSLWNHPFFTLSCVMLVFLFLCGIHKRVVAPSMYPYCHKTCFLWFQCIILCTVTLMF